YITVGPAPNAHPPLRRDRVSDRLDAADDRSLAQGPAQAVPELQAEGFHLTPEAKILRFRPGLCDQVGGHAGLDHIDSDIDPFSCLPIGVSLALRCPADIEGPVVAGAIAVVGLDDVEEGLVAGPDEAIGKDMWVRAAALAGAGVDRLDIVR